MGCELLCEEMPLVSKELFHPVIWMFGFETLQPPTWFPLNSSEVNLLMPFVSMNNHLTCILFFAFYCVQFNFNCFILNYSLKQNGLFLYQSYSIASTMFILKGSCKQMSSVSGKLQTGCSNAFWVNAATKIYRNKYRMRGWPKKLQMKAFEKALNWKSCMSLPVSTHSKVLSNK